MNPLDIRPSDTAASASPRSFSSRRPEAPAGFADAYNAAAGDQSSATTKSGPAADDDRTGSSAGKPGLSWDPRMKDAPGKETQGASADQGSDAMSADGDKPRLPGVHGEKPNDLNAEGDDASASGRSDDNKKDEKAVSGAVAVVATLPGIQPMKIAAAGDEQASLRPASALTPVKILVTQGEPAGVKLQTLSTHVSPEGEKSGKSALASLGSKLAELAKGGDAPRENDGVQGGKPGAGIAKAGNGNAAHEADAAGQGSRPRDEHATMKTEPPSGLTGLRFAPVPGARNASAIAAGIVANPAWSGALSAGGPAAAQQAAAARPVNALKIQLHPADLGVVTATLRLSGDRLVINLKVETAAAYRQLSADNRVIADKLKGHGYVVESIAVQHVAADRAAVPQSQQHAGFANPQQGGQAMAGGGGQPFGRGDGHNGAGNPRGFEEQTGTRETVSPAGPADRGPGGLYV